MDDAFPFPNGPLSPLTTQKPYQPPGDTLGTKSCLLSSGCYAQPERAPGTKDLHLPGLRRGPGSRLCLYSHAGPDVMFSKPPARKLPSEHLMGGSCSGF